MLFRSASGARAAGDSGARVIGAYYPGGSSGRYPIAQIPADRLTHLFYAFARIDDGQCVVGAEAGGHFVALAELKRRHPDLRTLISRKHVVITKNGAEFRCRDLDSANGLYLNGVKAHSAVLHDGDAIQIGDVVFVFHEGS